MCRGLKIKYKIFPYKRSLQRIKYIFIYRRRRMETPSQMPEPDDAPKDRKFLLPNLQQMESQTGQTAGAATQWSQLQHIRLSG